MDDIGLFMVEESHLQNLDISYLCRILNLHLNQELGASYWLKKANRLPLSFAVGKGSFEAFKQVFAFKNRRDQAIYEQHLRELPIEDFIPLATLQKARWLWASETGGTTGIAKRGTWSDYYWEQILKFSDEFLDLHGVPRKENWLYIGPTGPHTTGRLLISIAENRGGKIFCIDMDPRIVRIYLKEGDQKATERYIQHIWEQVVPIVKSQKIGVIFCTASLLEILPHHIEMTDLKKVKAIVHAGLAMSPDTHQYLRERLFPEKPVVGIYGTSVSGISYQKPYEQEDEHRLIYIPSQPYIVLEAIDTSGNLVSYDEMGDIRCFRFTEDQLIPGFIERDKCTRIKPFGKYKERYPWDWIGDPHSPNIVRGQQIEGVY